MVWSYYLVVREAAKKLVFFLVTRLLRPYPTPLELKCHKKNFIIFFEFQKTVFPPPLLVAGPLKKDRIIFCVFPYMVFKNSKLMVIEENAKLFTFTCIFFLQQQQYYIPLARLKNVLQPSPDSPHLGLCWPRGPAFRYTGLRIRSVNSPYFSC